MALDIDVGFEKQPRGLESFLKNEKYFPERVRGLGPNCTFYTRECNTWPKVFFYKKPVKVEEGDAPNWGEAGFHVVAEVNINYPAHDDNAIDEAERLSRKLIKRFNGILYDPDLDSYFRKDDL